MSDEKAYDPTSHRLEEERKRGSVPFSQDLARLGPMLAVVLVLAVGAGGFWKRAPSLLGSALRQAMDKRFSDEAAVAAISGSAEVSGQLVSGSFRQMLDLAGHLQIASILMGAFVFAIAFSLAQTRLAARQLGAGARNVDVLANLKNRFGTQNLWQNPWQMVLKLSVVTVLVLLALGGEWGRLRAISLLDSGRLKAAEQGPSWLASQATGSLLRLGGLSLAALGALALIDYFIQFRNFMGRLRMSHQERVDEEKKLEGDPETRHRIKQMGEELATVRFNRAVQDTVLVAINPTHLAVGISAARGGLAPRITVKAADQEALKLRSIAAKKGRPIIRDVEAARTMYEMDVGDPVPQQLLIALDETLRVLEKRGLLRKRPSLRPDA